LRQIHADDEFLKQLYKNFGNVIFGKCCQSTERYRDINLIYYWNRGRKFRDGARLLRDPRFKSFHIFDENLVAVELQKREVGIGWNGFGWN
jgi:hypothetical protein